MHHGSLNERQAREFVPLLREEDEEAVLDLWFELRDEFGDELTGDHVREAVEKKLRPKASTTASTNGDAGGSRGEKLVRAQQTLDRAYTPPPA